MFSGIIEATGQILALEPGDQALRLQIQRPSFFNDLRTGDSIAVNGICLTLESFSDERMDFSMGAETLKVLRLPQPESLRSKEVNLERSLKFGDRIHGHLVSGHVDFIAPVVRAEALGESWLIGFEVPKEYQTALWKKGSVTVQGVSLTVNEVLPIPGKDNVFEVQVCLIPETLKRTNLQKFRPSENLNIEMDWMAKALMASLAARLENLK